MKLVKDKNYFQMICEKKSIKEIENWLQIEWYASTKDKDRWHDIVEPTAFKDALELYMTNPIVLLQHNMDKPVWIVTEATIDEKWLYIKANITEDEDWILSKLKNWVIRAFSIWYRIKDYEDKEVKDSDWYTIWYETVIKDLELFEISLVSIPMNQYALMKSINDCFEKDLEINWNTMEQKAEITSNEEVVEETQEQIEEVEENNEETPIENWEENKNWSEENEDEGNVSNEEENEQNETDENSEIVEDENDNSENGDETAPNDETVIDETSNTEEVVEKALVIEDKKWFTLSKKDFDLEMSKKDMEIKKLSNDVKDLQNLVKECVEIISSLDKAVKSIDITSYSYERPARKSNNVFAKAVDIAKNS